MGWNARGRHEVDRLRTIAAALIGALDWRRHMKNIMEEAGEIIAQTTDDHTLVGGHRRLAVAASLGKRLFWRDTGEPVKIDDFFKHWKFSSYSLSRSPSVSLFGYIVMVVIAVALLPHGVSLASRTSLPLRREGHTKVYCGDQEGVMRPHARLMEKPTQIADCVTQQRLCSGPALCSDEHRTWQVYHAQSRFSLRCVPHADSGQPRAAGFELAGFLIV